MKIDGDTPLAPTVNENPTDKHGHWQPVLGVDVNPDPLLAIPSLATYIGISERHARLLVDQRRVSVVKIGRRVRVRRSEADRLINESTVEALRPLNGRSGEPR